MPYALSPISTVEGDTPGFAGRGRHPRPRASVRTLSQGAHHALKVGPHLLGDGEHSPGEVEEHGSDCESGGGLPVIAEHHLRKARLKYSSDNALGGGRGRCGTVSSCGACWAPALVNLA